MNQQNSQKTMKDFLMNLISAISKNRFQ